MNEKDLQTAWRNIAQDHSKRLQGSLKDERTAGPVLLFGSK